MASTTIIFRHASGAPSLLRSRLLLPAVAASSSTRVCLFGVTTSKSNQHRDSKKSSFSASSLSHLHSGFRSTSIASNKPSSMVTSVSSPLLLHRPSSVPSPPLWTCTATNQTTPVTVQGEASKEALNSQENSLPGSLEPSPGEAKGTETSASQPKEVFLKDYKPPSYSFEKVDLSFQLFEDHSLVHSRIIVKPVDIVASPPPPLVLNGEHLEMVSLSVNGKKLVPEEYDLTPKLLTLKSPPAENGSSFEFCATTKILPQENTALEGLYKSSGNFCTQCEAEGFRRITYFQDRPDVMSIFTTRIEADKEKYPVLLSNGNLVEQGQMESDPSRHFSVWEDPWKKPCYLFALVAGDLKRNDDEFVTMSGKRVALRIWVKEEELSRTGFAMLSLKHAMKWEEEVFGLEYDLDLFNIVAVPDFNMGAMENKSLNIFNSRLILASPETATDGDYSAIEGVVAHEYFHNWTGNRVTCRDWFQLSLKEGLTVFRDQEFSADMNSASVERINNVAYLRNAQFSEDSGPMAHPVRPQSYIKMDNFYTVTVYEKGAEVVRMYQTLLGKQGFRKGMDLYFARHDGQAVTCDDFLAAMRDANSANLDGFHLWLSQAGTPSVSVTSSYDEVNHMFTLKCKQEVPSTPGQPQKSPMLIPLSVGLLDSEGRDMPLRFKFTGGKLLALGGEEGQACHTCVMRLSEAEQEFTFTDIFERPVPSILRGFSAPVNLTTDLSEDDFLFLMKYDSDDFNRWEASHKLAIKYLLESVSEFKSHENEKLLKVNEKFLDAICSSVHDKTLDKAFIARVLSLPSEGEIADSVPSADPDVIHRVRRFFVAEIAKALNGGGINGTKLIELVNENSDPNAKYVPDHPSKARRSLKGVLLYYQAALDTASARTFLFADFHSAKNMADQVNALSALTTLPGDEREKALCQFYAQWKDDNLVMNKWLRIQSSSSVPNNLENVRKLVEHPAYNIREPNKNYALLGGFCSCPVNFHNSDGSGYQFIADKVIQLDKINAQVASRIVSSFTRWKKYDEQRQALAKVQLERILASEGLSDNVFEIVSKSLAV